jgi:uncharacterized repeat protein (TIGR01451 family)
MKFRLTLALAFIFFKTLLPAQNVVDSLTVNWETLNILGRGPAALEYQQAGNYLFYEWSGVLYRSADFGKTWTLNRRNVGKFFAFNSKVYIQEYRHLRSENVSLNCYHEFGISKFYLSENGGDTYTALDTSVYKNYKCNTGTSLRVSGIYEDIFLIDSTLIRRNYFDYSKKIEASKDGGKTWTTVMDSVNPTIALPYDYTVNSYYFKKSVNSSGKTTIVYGKQLNISDSTVIPLKTANFTSISFKDNILSIYTCNYTTNTTAVESTNDKGLNWTTSVLPFTFRQSGIFQDKETIYIVGNNIYKSTDASFKTYKKIYNEDTNIRSKNFCFSILPSGIYINGLTDELLRSTDKGDTWQLVNDIESYNFFQSLIAFKDTIWIQNHYWALFELTNFNSYKSIGNQEPKPMLLSTVEKGFKLDNKVFIGFWRYSNDNGITWTSFRDRIAVDSNRLVVFGYQKISESKDKGTTFQDWAYPNNMNITAGYSSIFIDSTLYSICYFDGKKFILKIKDERGIKKFDILTLNAECDIIKIFAEGKKLIAVSNCGKFYELDEAGATWIQFGAGFLKTTNTSWTATVEQYDKYYIFSPEYAAGYAYITGDKGLTWKKINMNFKNTALSGQYIYNNYSLYNNDNNFIPNYNDKRIRRIHVDSLFKSVLNETNYGILRGIVFKDENANCKKDSLEKPITEKIIRFEPNSYTAMTDKNGRFSVALPPNTYNISVYNSVRYNSPICSDTILKNITINPRQTRDTQFVFSKTLSVFDAAVSLTALTPARPGFEVEFLLKITNLGTETISDAVATLTIPAQFASFISADQGGTNLNGQITWSVKNLTIDESRSYRVRLKIDASTPLSTNLRFLGKTTILNKTDAYLIDNEDIVVLTVRGSYDPNDKTVSPTGKIPFFTNELDYLIRFQNTGTDTAFKVVVMDTLPTNLDVFTLKPIASSHPYTVSMNKNIVSFTFDNILLVDSFHNEKASHGFIRFKISPKKGVLVGDKISNKAAIYFDFNKPIITNAAVTEFVLTPTNDIETDFASFDIYPNPVRNDISIRYELKQATWIAIDLYNVIGQKVKILQKNTFYTEGGYLIEHDVKDLEAGIYQVALTTDKGTLFRKFVKMK